MLVNKKVSALGGVVTEFDTQRNRAVTGHMAASGHGSVGLPRRLHHTAAHRPRPEGRSRGRRAWLRQRLLIPGQLPYSTQATCMRAKVVYYIAIFSRKGRTTAFYQHVMELCTKLRPRAL